MLAPPPVETWETAVSNPCSAQNPAESPPPITETLPFFVASTTNPSKFLEPSANFGISVTYVMSNH